MGLPAVVNVIREGDVAIVLCPLGCGRYHLRVGETWLGCSWGACEGDLAVTLRPYHRGFAGWWTCLCCKCGLVMEVRATGLLPFFEVEAPDPRGPAHGNSRLSEYGIWRGMWDRCSNPRSVSYPYYGGRGIAVCAQWKEFERFLFDMGSRPSAALSIDRIDVNGNYEPGNCRWADATTQARNQRPRKRRP